MASQSTTLEDVALTTGVPREDLAKAYSVVGQAPAELASHATLKEFIINGITPEDFIKTHSAEGMSFAELKTAFKKICKDYGNTLNTNTKSKSLEFCSKIIYEVGPQSRSVKKADGDKMWKFKFFYKVTKAQTTTNIGAISKTTTAAVCKVCYVCTYKTDNTIFKQSTDPDRHLIMSVRMASLLCIETFCKLVEYCELATINKVFFTPLAGAIYSAKDIPDMALALKVSETDLIKTINSSCQSGGHMLEHSAAECAFAAAIAATKGLTNDKVRIQIVGKIVKQYITSGKEPDVQVLDVYLRYACGGVPSKYSPIKLIEEYDRIHISMRQYRPLPITSTVFTPIATASGTSSRAVSPSP